MGASLLEIYASGSNEMDALLEETFYSLFDWVKKNPSKRSPSCSEITGIHLTERFANKSQETSYAMNMLRGLPIVGDIDRRINNKVALKQFISTLVTIQERGISPGLLQELKTALSNPNIHSMSQMKMRAPDLIYMDQINFYDHGSGALDHIAFIPFGVTSQEWSILGAAMIQKNRFHQAASQLTPIGKSNIRTLRGWARSKNWQKLKDNPEVWGIIGSNRQETWLLKIKPEGSSRQGKLDPESNVGRFDARRAPGIYVNPFSGEVGKLAGTHIPLDTSYY